MEEENMMIKNGRIIISEDTLELDVRGLEAKLRNFFKTDNRFSKYDIAVFFEFDNECWSDKTCDTWNELNIHIVNYDKVVELGGQLAGEKRFASSCITYSTEGYEPCLAMVNNKPEFYYVFSGSSWTITNSVTWENNRDTVTVEDIVEEVLATLCKN